MTETPTSRWMQASMTRRARQDDGEVVSKWRRTQLTYFACWIEAGRLTVARRAVGDALRLTRRADDVLDLKLGPKLIEGWSPTRPDPTKEIPLASRAVRPRTVRATRRGVIRRESADHGKPGCRAQWGFRRGSCRGQRAGVRWRVLPRAQDDEPRVPPDAPIVDVSGMGHLVPPGAAALLVERQSIVVRSPVPDQEKPKRRDLRVEAYHWLRSRIMSAEIAPGTRITERQVAEQLGTSTVPVREALLLLAGHHLVAAHNGMGYEVAPVVASRADSTLRLQAHLDAEAAAVTAARKDSSVVPHLGAILDRVGHLSDHTWNDEPTCDAHFEFHQHIAAHAQHEALSKAVSDCLIETERIRRHLLRQGAAVHHDVDEHCALLEALGRGAARARKAAREHAEQHREQLLAALAQD